MLVVLSILGLGLWGWNQIGSLGRVDLEDSLTVPVGEARNYLVVGSDSREGLPADVENAGAIGLDVSGRRADTIIVLRLEGDRASMMSVPRDLWIQKPGEQGSGRINGTYADGPPNLVRAVTGNLGVPIHHYVEVDFKSFGSMVDALGGITIDFPNPVKDYNSALNILRAGPANLSGAQALAYVRSRQYTEVINGEDVKEPTADLGRQQRQQTFIRSLIGEMSDVRNPITLAKLAGAAGSGMKVDQTFGVGDAADLARRLAGTTPESVVLPTVPANRGGASVLLVNEPDAQPLLRDFGAE